MLLSTTHCISFEMLHKNLMLVNDTDISNFFNNYFSSTFSIPLTCDKLPTFSQCNFPLITDSEIRLVLIKMKDSSALGPDGVPFKFIKNNMDLFCKIFFYFI